MEFYEWFCLLMVPRIDFSISKWILMNLMYKQMYGRQIV